METGEVKERSTKRASSGRGARVTVTLGRHLPCSALACKGPSGDSGVSSCWSPGHHPAPDPAGTSPPSPPSAAPGAAPTRLGFPRNRPQQHPNASHAAQERSKEKGRAGGFGAGRPAQPPAPHPATVPLLGGGKLGLKGPATGERGAHPEPGHHAAPLLPEAAGTSVP